MRSLEVFGVSFPAEISYLRRDFLCQANLAAQMNILVPNPLIYMLSIAYFWFSLADFSLALTKTGTEKLKCMLTNFNQYCTGLYTKAKKYRIKVSFLGEKRVQSLEASVKFLNEKI